MKTNILSLRLFKIVSITFLFMICSSLYAGNSNGNWGKANYSNFSNSHNSFKKKLYIANKSFSNIKSIVNSISFKNSQKSKKYGKKVGFFSNFFNSFKRKKKYKKKKYKKKKYPKHTSVPLDGGLSILLLGAAVFGVRKLREKNNGN